MDDRAFSNLSSAPGDVQKAVLAQFKPRREGEDDYSALVSSFVRSIITKREQRARPPWRESQTNKQSQDDRDQSPMSAFRSRYPMDERAFSALQQSSPGVRDTVMSDFKPRREGDDDYSALVMTFVRAVMNRREHGPRPPGPPVNRREHGRGQEEYNHEEKPAAKRDHDPQDGEDDEESTPLSSFRLRYPMDDRAFSALQQASSAVQDVVISDFKPRREGEDDYSALVMSFVRAVQTRVGAGRPVSRGGGARNRD